MPSNNVALITGASRGIGAETAKLFARQGFAVCINYLSNVAAAESVRQEISKAGGRCIVVQADVSASEDVERLFEALDAQLGRLSVLVNNAAILRPQSKFADISESRFMEMLKTNVLSTFLCCKEASKRMSLKGGGIGGSIVNISSRAAVSGAPNEYVDYAASKGAIDTLTRGLAAELASEGIRVNGVRPGFIHTEMHASGGESNRLERLKSNIPLQRGGQPSEVAEAVLWLASMHASFVTGSFIDVAGGL